MKIMKSIFLALIFALSLNAQLSSQSMNYLSQDNFQQAKTSIEKDLSQDKYDAKAWYFYSRVLYELDYPKAAKEALNNALNIDKTASFAKGGMSALRSFGGDILDAIERNRREPNLNIPQITAEEYDDYLNQVFGRNHNYSNMNPPSESVLARAKAGTYSSSYSNESKANYPSSYARESKPSYTPSKKSNEEASGFSFIIIIFILGLGIFFLVKASKKPKKQAQPLPFDVDALVANINQLANDTEDLLKNVELINKNSLLYQELFNLNKKILLLSRQASTSPTLQSKQDYEEYKALYKILEDYFYKRDYDLRDYDKKKRELNQQNFTARQNFTANLNGKNEGLYDKKVFTKQSSQAPASSGSTLNFLGGLLNFIGSILKILLIVGMSNRSSGGSTSGRSRGNDDFFGGGSRSNKNNSNDDFWGSARSSRNNSNDDFWGSARSSRNNSNDSFWGSSGGSSRGGGSKSNGW